MRKTVVLIHGFGFDSRIWMPVDIAFDGFDVIRLSLPGFGNEPPGSSYTISSLAKDYWKQLDLHSYPRVHLIGHSMGGYVCIEMAAQHPERVASLTLVHSHIFADTDEKKTQRTTTIEDIKLNGRSGLVRKMIPALFADATTYKPLVDNLVERGMSYTDPAWYFGTQAMRDRTDHRETLASLKVPVLMIAGKNDGAVPVDFIYRQASLPENNSLMVYEDAGHMAMFEKTAQMISDLISFFRRIDP
jgi:pimeloyl-ACP methyl ester carboxylesterase